MDKAHSNTNKILSKNEAQMKKAYTDAYKDIKGEVAELYSKIDLSSEDINERLANANKYDRLNKITDKITAVILETNKAELKTINNVANEVYQENYNAILEKVEDKNTITKTAAKTEAKENANPYNEIAIDNLKDEKRVKGKVKSSLLSSAINGIGIAGMLASIRKIFESNLADEVRMLETNTTGIENNARLHAFDEIKPLMAKEGYEIVKVWNTQGDDRVRDGHARTQGQEAPIDEPFYVNGEKLMFPGDPKGSAGNIINCRCYMTYKLVKNR